MNATRAAFRRRPAAMVALILALVWIALITRELLDAHGDPFEEGFVLWAGLIFDASNNGIIVIVALAWLVEQTGIVRGSR
jgi:hypothetical protein